MFHQSNCCDFFHRITDQQWFACGRRFDHQKSKFFALASQYWQPNMPQSITATNLRMQTNCFNSTVMDSSDTVSRENHSVKKPRIFLQRRNFSTEKLKIATEVAMFIISVRNLRNQWIDTFNQSLN